jgi:lauroyl/myristoyl acyltransferase
MNLELQLRRFGVFVLRIIPLRFADTVATLLGVIFYHILKQRRLCIESNLRRVFFDRNIQPEKFNKYVKNTFVNYGRHMVDFLRLGFMSGEDFSVEVVGIEHVFEALKLNRGCVLLTLHLGNWDYAGAYLAARGVPISALVEDIDPVMLDLYTEHRERTGMKTFPVSRSAFAFVDTIRKNRLLAILGDRDVVGNGIPVPFFSGMRKVPRGLGEIIIKKQMPVVFGYMVFHPRKKQRYLGYIEPPVFFTGGADEFNRQMVKKFEEFIKTYPDQWIVFQPEWINQVKA